MYGGCCCVASLLLLRAPCALCLQEWNFLRGGLTTLDRDYGIFSKIHHSIGIHVVHHLFPQVRQAHERRLAYQKDGSLG